MHTGGRIGVGASDRYGTTVSTYFLSRISGRRNSGIDNTVLSLLGQSYAICRAVCPEQGAINQMTLSCFIWTPFTAIVIHVGTNPAPVVELLAVFFIKIVN